MGGKTHHEVKVSREDLIEMKKGNKTFDIRKNTKNFNVGDSICFKEFTDGKYVEFSFEFGIITYVTNHEQKDGYVVFSFRIIK